MCRCGCRGRPTPRRLLRAACSRCPCRRRRSAAGERSPGDPARGRRGRGRFLPHHVGSDAGADHRRPVTRPLPRRPGAVRVEAVAEGSVRALREEAVLPAPARPVRRLPGVQVEVAPEVVQRAPLSRHTEAVDGRAAIGVAPVEMVEASVGPVRPDLEHGQRPRPVGEAKLPPAPPATVVRLQPLPALQRPVRPVRRLARADHPGERRPVVAAAARALDRPVAVAKPKRDLRHPGAGRARVDRVPRDDVTGGTGLVPAHMRLADAVHLQAGAAPVTADQLGRGGVADEGKRDEGEHAGACEHRTPSVTGAADDRSRAQGRKRGPRLGLVLGGVRVRRHARSSPAR